MYTVTGQGKIPKDWKAFLNSSENKIELFAFLTDEVIASARDERLTATIVCTKSGA